MYRLPWDVLRKIFAICLKPDSFYNFWKLYIFAVHLRRWLRCDVMWILWILFPFSGLEMLLHLAATHLSCILRSKSDAHRPENSPCLLDVKTTCSLTYVTALEKETCGLDCCWSGLGFRLVHRWRYKAGHSGTVKTFKTFLIDSMFNSNWLILWPRRI